MAESASRSRWMGRAAMAGWVIVGAAAVLIAPEPGPAAPQNAEAIYGHRPSAQSSARAGLFAFSGLLERLGLEVILHGRNQAPNADVWVMLEPQLGLAAEEVELVLEWVGEGRTLIYAPPEMTFEQLIGRARQQEPDAWGEPEAEAEPEPSSSAAEEPDVGEDRLIAAVETMTSEPPRVYGDATLFRVGGGHVALLENGPDSLSNEALMADGISAQLAWLRPVLRGHSRVAFDEGRLGLAEGEGTIGLIMASRFGPAVKLALLGLLLLLVARFVRREPAQPDPPAGGRAFGEHIDAVGRVLERSSRRRLALRSLAAGTRRRLGALAATPAVATILDGAAAADVSRRSATVARIAERLRQLEADAGVGTNGHRQRP